MISFARRMLVAACTAGLAISLTACGGGGGGSAAPPVATPAPTPVPTSTPGIGCSSADRNGLGMYRSAPHTGQIGIVPNRLYVSYSAGARTMQSVERASGAVRADDIGTFGGAVHRALTFASAEDTARATATLRSTAGVTTVAPLHYRRLSGDLQANDAVLNNTYQWYLYKENADPTAWNLTHGSAAVKVAIVDTGVDVANNVDITSKLDYSASYVNSEPIPVNTAPTAVQDTNGHGTNVAGLAAAATNNTFGFAGVGYDTHLIAYRIFPQTTASCDQQSADTGDEAKAITNAVAQGATVISLSLGSPQSTGQDAVEKAAIENAITAGVTVVAAAGNEYPTTDGQQLDFPAAYPNVIAVGASAVQDTTPNVYSSIIAEKDASYSNSGPALLAPGGDEDPNVPGGDNDYLHWITGYSTTRSNFVKDQCSGTFPNHQGNVCAALFNGTSQATPQVAGAVALMQGYRLNKGKSKLSPASVSSILQSTAYPLGLPPSRQGAGRLDVGAAVAAALAAP